MTRGEGDASAAWTAIAARAKSLDRRPSRWTHRVGVTGCGAAATPTRNAIGLSRPTTCVAAGADGRLSPWRSVLPPRGGGVAREPDAASRGLCGLVSCLIAAGLTGLPLLSSSVFAQTMLPGIVVQGATLASPQPAASAPAQSPGPTALPPARAWRPMAPRARSPAFPATPSAMRSRSSPARSCAPSRCGMPPRRCAACPASPSTAAAASAISRRCASAAPRATRRWC